MSLIDVLAGWGVVVAISGAVALLLVRLHTTARLALLGISGSLWLLFMVAISGGPDNPLNFVTLIAFVGVLGGVFAEIWLFARRKRLQKRGPA
jgi:hypothetical protein